VLAGIWDASRVADFDPIVLRQRVAQRRQNRQNRLDGNFSIFAGRLPTACARQATRSQRVLPPF